MKILLVHTYYREKGGEDTVFESEFRLLQTGNEVKTLIFRNLSGLKGMFEFFISIWNFRAGRTLRKVVIEFKPDVIHIHNWHFGSGPNIIRTAKKSGIPVVITLHNYRLLCPSATLLYQGQIFTDSLKRGFPWKAIRKKVYRNSTIQTFWLAFINWFHKKIGTWDMVDRYLILTEFARNLFLNSTLRIPPKKLIVKPNFVDGPDFSDNLREDHFLFIGRLSPEKGLSVLLQAFRDKKAKLIIAGIGPLLPDVLDACKSNQNIHYAGNLNKAEIQIALQKCTALIFPSIWYEGMPMTLLEAFSNGTPVIASNLGAMSSMIRHGYNGLHFASGDSDSLVQTVNNWQNMNSNKKGIYSRNAYTEYDKKYTPPRNKNLMTEIYETVIQNSKI